MFEQMRKSPYLKLNRLGDVLAAIQTMALHQRYRVHVTEWALLISGSKEHELRWKEVFDDHPEFFRKSSAYKDHYALVWRRALSSRYSVKLGRLVTAEEYKAMPKQERDDELTRPPVPVEQMKILFDTAIGLHQRAIDASRDWRWWVAPVVAALTSFVGAIIGVMIKH